MEFIYRLFKRKKFIREQPILAGAKGKQKLIENDKAENDKKLETYSWTGIDKIEQNFYNVSIKDFSTHSNLTLLFCKDCSKSFLLAADSFIAPLNELFKEINVSKDVYFVAPVTNISDADKLLCINNIKTIRKKINDGKKVLWICSGCSDIKKTNEFPKYFGLIHSLDKNIMYYLMDQKGLAFIIFKKLFIESLMIKSGIQSVEEIVVVMYGLIAMEKILGFESSKTLDELFNVETSRVLNYYKRGYNAEERQSSIDLLQEGIPEWDVPVWVVTFFK
jgi:hypothetical protein